MTEFVVDASIVLKWLVPESDSAQAMRLLQAGTLSAPDLIWPEIGNILWKLVRRGRTTLDRAEKICAGLSDLPVKIQSSAAVLDDALIYAHVLNCSVYDSIYLAVAIRHGRPLVTADRKLYKAVAKSGLARHILLLDDL